MTIPKLIHFHDNHIVMCKKCKCIVLKPLQQRFLYSRYIMLYRCLFCYFQFTCCSKDRAIVVQKMYH